MTDLTTCLHCRHFQPDESNATAAMGRCMHPARHGYFFAGQWHRCKDFEAKPETAPTL